MRTKCIVKLVISIFFVISSKTSFAQYNWETGDISVKSKTYTVLVDSNKSVTFKSKTVDPKTELPLGYSQETGRVMVAVKSAREIVEIFREAFSQEKLERMSMVEKDIVFILSIDEDGVPFSITFRLRPNTSITPDELFFIENEFLKRVRYIIKREKPYGKDCIYTSGGYVKFQDILNGEIPALKISEQRGKEKAEWER